MAKGDSKSAVKSPECRKVRGEEAGRRAGRVEPGRGGASARSVSPTRSPPYDQAVETCSLSNALLEAVNTRIRLLTRRAFGFHSSSKPLTALALPSFGGFRPALPGRAA